jgi:hypothetical protein
MVRKGWFAGALGVESVPGQVLFAWFTAGRTAVSVDRTGGVFGQYLPRSTPIANAPRPVPVE